MKLISSGSKRKPLPRQHNNVTVSQPTPVQIKRTGRKKMPGGKKAIIITCSILGAIVLLLGAAFIIIRWEVQPLYDIFFPTPAPSTLGTIRTPRSGNSSGDNDPINPDTGTNLLSPNNPATAISAPARRENVYTFLILGIDGFRNLRSEGGANTDVVMIGTIDLNEHSFEVASIPRDTIVNVPWNVKKINSIWANVKNRNRNSDNHTVMTQTVEHFADLTGYYVDYWLTLDMDAFVSLVNALPDGGVTVNVPYRVRLIDPDIGLNVTLNPGEQKLNGMQALAFARVRDIGGDFARIGAQQIIIKATVEQFLAKRDSINISTYINVLLKYVNIGMYDGSSGTSKDVPLNELIRLGREMMKMTASDNINFHTAEGTVYNVRGSGAGSYVYIHLDNWLEILNTKLSPFDKEFTPADVSILTMGEDNRFYVTDGHWQGSESWGR